VGAKRKIFTKSFVEDLAYWRATDKKICEKIEKLIEYSAQEPLPVLVNPNRCATSCQAAGAGELIANTGSSTNQKATRLPFTSAASTMGANKQRRRFCGAASRALRSSEQAPVLSLP
jgi:hypothetical protein